MEKASLKSPTKTRKTLTLAEKKAKLETGKSKIALQEAKIAVDELKEFVSNLKVANVGSLFTVVKANKPGTATISEAQLIGRGARYCPFTINEES